MIIQNPKDSIKNIKKFLLEKQLKIV